MAAPNVQNAVVLSAFRATSEVVINSEAQLGDDLF
jgi:hypothetical protein